jgi:uncharacterized protein YkwD
MDTERFDSLASALTTSGTRRQALRTLAGLAGALAVSSTLGTDEGEAKKKGKKGKGKKGGKGNKGGGTYEGGQSGGGNAGGDGTNGGNGDSNGSGNGDGGGNGDGDGGGNGGGNNGGNAGGNTTQSEEEKLLDLINGFRAQNGQPALTRNGKLDTAALNHSRDMANRGFFSHNTPEGGTPDQRLTAAGYSFSWWGENIYKSAPGDASAQSAFTSWVNSSGHRANMLSSNFTQIGIGRATAADGRTYWTNTFGKPA